VPVSVGSERSLISCLYQG